MTSTRQFVWCGDRRCEARNATSGITAQFFSLGETISATDYFYTKDHLGSIREMTNSSGTVEAQYAYDPYGQVTKLQGSLASDFQFAGYYEHPASSLNLTATRAYHAAMGRFINRDPIEEAGGLNLYGYALNSPVASSDPSGLDCTCHIDWDKVRLARDWGEAVGGLAGAYLGGGSGGAAGFLGGGGVGAIPAGEAGAVVGGIGGAAVGGILAGAGSLAGQYINGMTSGSSSGGSAGSSGQQGQTGNPTPSASPPANPADSPGQGWQWEGSGPQGSSQGSWWNPQTGESLHPDLNHPAPIGPHWDYTIRGSKCRGWRIFPDGRMEAK